MRVLGVILFLFGLVLCFTIIGAIFGIPMMIAGVVLAAMGGRRKTVIHNVVTVTNAPAMSPAIPMTAAPAAMPDSQISANAEQLRIEPRP